MNKAKHEWLFWPFFAVGVLVAVLVHMHQHGVLEVHIKLEGEVTWDGLLTALATLMTGVIAYLGIWQTRKVYRRDIEERDRQAAAVFLNESTQLLSDLRSRMKRLVLIKEQSDKLYFEVRINDSSSFSSQDYENALANAVNQNLASLNKLSSEVNSYQALAYHGRLRTLEASLQKEHEKANILWFIGTDLFSATEERQARINNLINHYSALIDSLSAQRKRASQKVNEFIAI